MWLYHIARESLPFKKWRYVFVTFSTSLHPLSTRLTEKTLLSRQHSQLLKRLVLLYVQCSRHTALRALKGYENV